MTILEINFYRHSKFNAKTLIVATIYKINISIHVVTVLIKLYFYQERAIFF